MCNLTPPVGTVTGTQSIRVSIADEKKKEMQEKLSKKRFRGGVDGSELH